MSEDLDSMAKRFKEVRNAFKGAAGRPEVTLKDTFTLMRQNIAGKIYSWTRSRVHQQEASHEQTAPQVLAQQQGGPPQEQSSLLGQGRPAILGSMMGGFQQQQAPQQPQMSDEEIEFQRREQVAYQRAREKALNEQKKLATLKKRRGMSIEGT